MRKLVFVLLGLAVLVASAWTGLWLYAAHLANGEIDGWIAAEAQEGRIWSCSDRTIAGYPLALTLSCARPHFEGHAPDQTVIIDAADFSATASVLEPHRMTARLEAPLAYRTSDGETEAKLAWGTLSAEISGLPNVQAATLRGRDVSFSGRFGEAGAQEGRTREFEARLTWPDQPDDPSVAFDIALRGAPLPALDTLLDKSAPTDADLLGSFNRVDVSAARTPEEALDIWRRAGGELRLSPSRVSHAESSVSGSGRLTLDDAHRPQGRIDASFVGLEPVLKRYGIDVNLAAAGSLLSSLFGGAAPAPASAHQAALTLPIVFRDGRLGIGPIRTQLAVPPLY